MLGTSHFVRAYEEGRAQVTALFLATEWFQPERACREHEVATKQTTSHAPLTHLTPAVCHTAKLCTLVIQPSLSSSSQGSILAKIRAHHKARETIIVTISWQSTAYHGSVMSDHLATLRQTPCSMGEDTIHEYIPSLLQLDIPGAPSRLPLPNIQPNSAPPHVRSERLRNSQGRQQNLGKKRHVNSTQTNSRR